jgi:hypothetical protein
MRIAPVRIVKQEAWERRPAEKFRLTFRRPYQHLCLVIRYGETNPPQGAKFNCIVASQPNERPLVAASNPRRRRLNLGIQPALLRFETPLLYAVKWQDN